MRVYHLLTAENGLSDISLRRIRISRFADLNDPFELLAAHLGEKSFRTAVRNWRTELNATHGLLCFSKNWENPVLWSHYAAKHHGMCLGFELQDDLAQEVHYIKDRLPIRFKPNGPEKRLDETFVRELLASKYEHWKYEEEIRVFLSLDPSTIESGSYFFSFSDKLQLAEVILGPLCELPIAEVGNLVRGAYGRVPVTKARLAFKWFNVVYDERSVKEENSYWASKGSTGHAA